MSVRVYAGVCVCVCVCVRACVRTCVWVWVGVGVGVCVGGMVREGGRDRVRKEGEGRECGSVRVND